MSKPINTYIIVTLVSVYPDGRIAHEDMPVPDGGSVAILQPGEVLSVAKAGDPIEESLESLALEIESKGLPELSPQEKEISWPKRESPRAIEFSLQEKAFCAEIDDDWSASKWVDGVQERPSKFTDPVYYSGSHDSDLRLWFNAVIKYRAKLADYVETSPDAETARQRNHEVKSFRRRIDSIIKKLMTEIRKRKLDWIDVRVRLDQSFPRSKPVPKSKACEKVLAPRPSHIKPGPDNEVVSIKGSPGLAMARFLPPAEN